MNSLPFNPSSLPTRQIARTDSKKAPELYFKARRKEALKAAKIG